MRLGDSNYAFRISKREARNLAEMAVRLATVFGGNAESWLIQQAQYDLAKLPTDHLNLKKLVFAQG